MSKLLIILLALYSINIFSAVFLNGKLEKKDNSVQSHYDELGLGDIVLKINKCDKRRKNCKTDVLAISFKNKIKSRKKIFSFDFGNVSIVAKGRYLNHSSIILKQIVHVVDPTTKDKKIIDRYWLISNKSGEFLKTETLNPKNKIIKKDDSPLILENFGLMKFKVSKVSYATEPSGKISLALIDDKNNLRVSNGEKWILVKNYSLKNHVKKDNILSVYPDSSSNKVYIAIHKYINPFNKGLDLIVVDFDKNDYFNTTIYSSDEFNYGLSPKVYTTNENIIISAFDLDSNTRKSIINKKSDLESIRNSKSPYIKGFENKSFYSFVIGISLVKNFWYMTAKVSSFADTKYHLESLFSYLGYFQARVKDISLKVSYLQSKMDEQKNIDGEFSQLLAMNLSWNSFFNKKLTLKVFVEYSNLNGVAVSNYGKNELPNSSKESITESFNMKSWRGDLLFIWNDKLYWGLSYLKYSMPSVIGLKDNDVKIVYTGYDKDLNSNNIEFLLGYNIPSYVDYGKVNKTKFYIGGNLGIGLGFLDISSELLSKIKLAVGDKTIINKYTVNFSGEIETGFIYQRRFRKLSGMGYSLVVGFRLKGNLFTSSLNDEDKPEDQELTKVNGTELSFEHQNLYINYGPFVVFSWIF